MANFFTGSLSLSSATGVSPLRYILKSTVGGPLSYLCNPHSVLPKFFHRPDRESSPGSTGAVQ
jgi:hypothetical protein